VRGRKWELPAAITELRELACLAFGGDDAAPGGAMALYAWRAASWSRVTALEDLRVFGLVKHRFPLGLNLGIAALSRLTRLNLSTCCYEDEGELFELAAPVRRPPAARSRRRSAPAALARGLMRSLRRRPCAAYCAAVAAAHARHAPRGTARRRARGGDGDSAPRLVAGPPRECRHLERLTRLEFVASPACDVGLLADAVALRELVFVNAVGGAGTDDERTDNEGVRYGAAAPLAAAGEGADGEGDPFADATFERIAQQPLPVLGRVMLPARNFAARGSQRGPAGVGGAQILEEGL
jgi:hypothetical protein